MRRYFLCLVLSCVTLAAGAGGNTSSDVQIDIDAFGSTSYFVVGFTPMSANVAPTGAGNPNPNMQLDIGLRYAITNPQQFAHPFSIIALDPGFSDVLLLGQGPFGGSFEADPAVDFHDGGATIYFTLTPPLADAMFQGGLTPGYRCEAHFNLMRGAITPRSAGGDLGWTSGAEGFENALLGTSVDTAFTGWVIVGGGVGTYEATIEENPIGDAGQDPASTRWLRVFDNDMVTSSRVYSPTITTGGDVVQSYTWTFLMNVESIAARTLVVSQHNDGAFRNVGGLEVTTTGVNVIIVGTTGTDVGIGATGPDITMPLYAFADTNFGMGEWVTLEVTLDLAAGEIRGTATGSDGTTVVNATATGLELTSATAGADVFRFCIRNNAAGSTSTINYDSLSILGVPLITAAHGWTLYGE